MVIDQINYPLILTAALLATASPGPSTLAIAGTAMAQGRVPALALVAGITSGSWLWSIAAALGLSALMLANAWVFEILRYLGAGYLLFLAFKSARRALAPGKTIFRSVSAQSLGRAYGKGLAMHLTNPKAILFFGALYSVGVPPTASPGKWLPWSWLSVCRVLLFFGSYALLFSNPRVVGAYVRLSRWFEAAFASGIRICRAEVANGAFWLRPGRPAKQIIDAMAWRPLGRCRSYTFPVPVPHAFDHGAYDLFDSRTVSSSVFVGIICEGFVVQVPLQDQV
jgi:threonine efflux protein